MRKRVFIAHQLSGDLIANLKSAKQWCRWAIFMRNANPIAPYLILMSVLDERDEDEREIGLALGDEFILTCVEFWICGPLPSDDSHVWEEARIAEQGRVKIIDYTGLILPTDFHSVKSRPIPSS